MTRDLLPMLAADDLNLRRILVLIGLVFALGTIVRRQWRRRRRSTRRQRVQAAYARDSRAAARVYRADTYADWLDAEFDQETSK